MQVIVTAPPYADYLDEVAAHPLVSAFRLNTVMPVKGGPEEALARFSGAASLRSTSGTSTGVFDASSARVRHHSDPHR